jgi:branched-chain amino acid transport system substrate-binding protein
MALLRSCAAAALLASAGCAQTLNFNDCNSDTDCAALTPDGGAMLYCTDDHLCVQGVPESKLCPDTVGDETANPKLEVAVLYDNTYDLDVQSANAAKLAISEINQRQSGASQPQIVGHFCTTNSDVDQTLKATRYAVEHFGVAAIVGPTTSGGLVNINSYIVQTGTLVISPSATAIDISSLQDQGLVWRTAPSDALQGKTLAQKIAAAAMMVMTTKVVDSFHDDTLYASGLDSAFQSSYGAILGPGYHKSYSYGAGDLIDLNTKLNSVAQDAPTQLLLVSDSDDPAIVALLATQPGLATTQFFMSDTGKDTSIFGNVMNPVDPTVLARIRGTAPSVPTTSPIYTTFRNAFIQMFTNDPSGYSFVANSYDAMYLVAIAAGATAGRVPNGRDLAMGMTKVVSTGAALPVGPNSYLMALQQIAGGGVHMAGASGPLEFDQNGDLLNGSYEYWCINTAGSAPRFSDVNEMTNTCP